MKPLFSAGHITATCPDCGVPTRFEWRQPGSNTEFGTIIIDKQHEFAEQTLIRTFYTCRAGTGVIAEGLGS